MTFWNEEKEVPFDENGKLLPRGEKRVEKTGRIKFDQFAIFEDREIEPGKIEKIKIGYDIEAVAQGATYECAKCEKDIDRSDLNGMLAAAQTADDWWPHNPCAPKDHVSAHLSALYSVFQSWGAAAKEFLLAKGNAARMRKFHNLTLGLPFIRHATTIKEDDIDRAAKRCPKPYLKGQLPLKPEILSMTVDVGGMVSGNFWWSIRAWGVLWDHPEQPTWSALVDWGPAVSWEQIEEMAGLKPLPVGGTAQSIRDLGRERYNEYSWRDPGTGEITKFRVTCGLVDSGYEAKEDKNVYEFVMKHSHVFSASKGGGQQHLRGNTIRVTQVDYRDDKLDLGTVTTRKTAFLLWKPDEHRI